MILLPPPESSPLFSRGVQTRRQAQAVELGQLAIEAQTISISDDDSVDEEPGDPNPEGSETSSELSDPNTELLETLSRSSGSRGRYLSTNKGSKQYSSSLACSEYSEAYK
jgi:hypothetical protein